MKRDDFLQHVAWTGTGLLWTLTSAGTLAAPASAADVGSFSFVQISDSHIGFHQAPNEDVTATLQKAVDAINALPVAPAFVMHTGDVSHLAKPDQFDTAKQMLATLKVPYYTIPGEHDMLGDNGKGYFAALGRRGDPWRLAAPLAAAAAFVLLVGMTVSAQLQMTSMRARMRADDIVLATIATSHFNHVECAKAVRDAPTAKVLNARSGDWLYLIVAAPVRGLHLVAERDGALVDFGVVQPHGRTATLFVRSPGRVARLELRRDGETLETATPSYAE